MPSGVRELFAELGGGAAALKAGRGRRFAKANPLSWGSVPLPLTKRKAKPFAAPAPLHTQKEACRSKPHKELRTHIAKTDKNVKDEKKTMGK